MATNKTEDTTNAPLTKPKIPAKNKPLIKISLFNSVIYPLNILLTFDKTIIKIFFKKNEMNHKLIFSR